MATNLTRINNNQITDASTGNVYLGVNAAVKLQNYTVTSQKLANNINYNSDLQVTGNLTVTGTTTTVDTVNTLIEDPLIVLASGQTSGTPTVDIGYIGLRGVDNNIALAWKEGDSEFVAAFTTTDSGNSYSNTTFSIASYADFKANNITANGTLTVTGTTTFVGNIIAANVTNDVTAGNVYTVNNVSAAGNVLAGTYFVGDGGYISNINAGNVSTYKIFNGGSYANINTPDANLVVAIGNSSNLVATFYDTGVNLNGLLSVNGNITGGNITTTGPSGNISGANVISSTTLSASGNVYGSNIVTPNTVINGGVSSSGDILTSGNVTATVNVTGGNIYTANVVSAGGNVLGSAIYATGSGDISTAGNVWAGIGVNTPNVVSATALALTAQSGDVNISATGNIGVNNLYIQNLHDPLNNQDAATKYYVDTVAQGLTIIASTYAVAAQPLANISGGTITYNNGNAGVGANLVTTGAYTTIDSVNIAVANTRILVVGQANAVQNGVYVYSNATVLTRSADYDEAAQIQPGDFVFNQYGNAYGNTQWVQTANVTTIGTDPITFTQFGGAGTYTAGNGIVINGVVISARVDTDTITFSGTGNLKVSDTANLVSPNIGNATGSSLSIVGTITADINVSVGGNVISGNINVGNNVSAGGNIYGGNISTTGSGGNITGANVISGTTLTATGNVYGGNLVAGNITIPSSGNINAGTNYINNVIDPIQAQDAATKGYVDGFISGGITIADTDANTTVLALNGTLSLIGTTNQVNVHITGPDAVTFSFPTDISIAGNVEAGNVNAGNVNAGNIVISGDDITDTNGRVNFNTALGTVDFAVNGTAANVFYVSATNNSASFGSSTQTVNALVAFNTSTSILAPVGNTNQRPPTGVTGMLRFNSTTNSLEIYNNTQWIGVGSTVFTVIADEQFAGDGSTVAYTLGSTQTTNSVIVSINGVLQIPTTAYSVSGVYPTCVLTFTEAPEPGDTIDVREITTTTTVNSITNSDESAKLLADPTYAQIDITGNLIPTSNVLQTLGNATNQWKSLYVSGNTIYLGGLQLQASGNTFAVYSSDGTTPATLDVGNIDVSSITAGNSSLGFRGTNGNAFITVNGTANVLTATTTGVNVLGNLSVSGNITGNFNLDSAVSASGNVIGGNLLTGGLISATGNVTGANLTITGYGTVLTGGNIIANINISAGANVIGGNLLTSGLISASGNITGSNFIGNGYTLTGINGANVTGLNTAAITNGTSNVNIATSGGNITAAVNGTPNVVVISTTGVSVAGTVQANGTITGGNLSAGTGYISTSGNITGGNVVYGTGVVSGTGTVYAATVNAATIGNSGAVHNGATVSITGTVTAASVVGGVITGSSVSVSGNITGGNISIGSGASTAGSYSASGNVTGGNVLFGSGIVSGTGNINGANITVSGGFYNGNISIVGANIVSAGPTLYIDPNGAGGTDGNVIITGNLTVQGTTTTINSNTVTTNDLFINVANNASTAAQANGGGLGVGPVGAEYASLLYSSSANSWQMSIPLSVTGTVTAASVVGGVITGTSVSVSGNITGGNISIGSGTSTAGSYSASGNVTGGNVIYGTGVVSGTGTVYAATVNAATIGNTGAVHNGTTVSATGNVTGGNIIATGVLISSNTVSATGNITGGNVIVSGVLISTNTISATGNITAGNISTGSGASTAGSYSASGNITGGNVTTAGQLTVNSGANVTAIVNGATSGVGNIGTATVGFNTVFAKATTAQYADLAEKYTADAEYQPGTVVSFGGDAEITLSDTDADRRIAGVVSTQPAYSMNSGLQSEFTVMVALTGRVPCSVVGSVRKGDMMVAAGNGQARAEANPAVGTVIGKALEDFDGESGVIEVVVGRL